MLFALVCARLCTKVRFFCKNLCIVCFLFAVSGNSITFVPWIPALQRWCEEGLYRKKGVIEIIFMDNKADIVPTPLFYILYCFLLGIGEAKNN